MIDASRAAARDAEVVTLRHATPEPALVEWLRHHGRAVSAALWATPAFAAVYFAGQLARLVLS